jgi:cob(I)alamin adenosyltransferase
MRIYTRGGDDGSTGLRGGARVGKDTLRVAAYGDVDETSSALGVARAQAPDPRLDATLARIQDLLFELGAQLSSPPDAPSAQGVRDDDVLWLERTIDEAEAELEPLKSFILAGGAPAAAHLFLARAVCRRAERSLVALGRREAVGERARQYLYRLSDLLFVLGRTLNRAARRGDVLWQHERR